MHTFPDLNSIFSLPVAVVVCLYVHIHVIGVSCTGKSGSGIGDRGCGSLFAGEGGRVFRFIGKFAALFLGEK